MAGYLDGFREVWAVDFEFRCEQEGDRPDPVCLAAWELKSGRKLRLWQDQFAKSPPYSIGPDSLFVAYYASAEFGCHLSLGWPLPERVLDLYVEFRWLTNGTKPENGNSLLGALSYFGLDTIAAEEKTEMRNLVLRGGPWTQAEPTAILDYCESDVAALSRLLPRMLPRLDFGRALYRGRYIRSVARMENEGVPIDTETFRRLNDNWGRVQEILMTSTTPTGKSLKAIRSENPGLLGG